MKNNLKILNRFCVFALVLSFVFCLNFFNYSSDFLSIKDDVYAKDNASPVNSYAKVFESCFLYKSRDMIDDILNIYFQVPETYFILILEDVDEVCFKVKYDRFVGYVKKSCVEVMSFIPLVKTLENITCDVKTSSGTQIWKNPSTDSDIYTTLMAGTKNLNYIASTKGDVPLGGKSDIWFYVFYTSDLNSTNVYEGYVYSENITNLSEIVLNSETNPEVISNEFDDEKLLFISSTIKTVIVAVVAIPVILFFVIILYKLIKKFKKNTKYNKNSNKIESADVGEFVKTQNIRSIEKYKNMTLLKNKNNSLQTVEYDDEDLL